MVASPPRRADPTDLHEPLLGVLVRFVSMPTAQSIVKLARRRTAGGDGPIDRASLRAMLDAIEHHLRLYVEDAVARRQAGHALRALVDGGADAPAESFALEIRAEEDIGHARIAARELAARRGFSAGGQTRLVTVVSELTRNIVQYARAGRVELRFVSSPAAGVEVTASDNGPGIPNLEEIFSGKYKSKLGMGQGLLGVKRLAQSFDVKTAAGKGTTVTAFFRVL